jgi:hypothetical protein
VAGIGSTRGRDLWILVASVMVSNTCTSRGCSSAPNRIASVCGAWGGSVTFYLTRVGLGSSWVMGQCTEAWTHEGSGEESRMSGSSGRRTSSREARARIILVISRIVRDRLDSIS